MDLNEQAASGVDTVLTATSVGLTSVEMSAARMIWLDGFAAGVAATKALAYEAIAAGNEEGS